MDTDNTSISLISESESEDLTFVNPYDVRDHDGDRHAICHACAHNMDIYGRFLDTDCCCDWCICMNNWCCMIAFDKLCDYPPHNCEIIPAGICLLIISIIFFPVSITYCIYAWCQERTLPIDIINNWSEYQRMLNNIAWTDSIYVKQAQRIHLTSHPEYYNLFNFIFQKTGNTPSKIRSFQQLIYMLKNNQKSVLIKFCQFKCGIRAVNNRASDYDINANACEPLLYMDYDINRKIHIFNSLLVIVFVWSLWCGIDIALSVIGFTNFTACQNEGIVMDIDISARIIGLGSIAIGLLFVSLVTVFGCKRFVAKSKQKLFGMLLFFLICCGLYSTGMIILMMNSVDISSDCRKSLLWKTVIVWCVIRGLMMVILCFCFCKRAYRQWRVLCLEDYN
eukprot:510404_1